MYNEFFCPETPPSTEVDISTSHVIKPQRLCLLQGHHLWFGADISLLTLLFEVVKNWPAGTRLQFRFFTSCDDGYLPRWRPGSLVVCPFWP